jgi:hypothetical protein
MALFFECTLWCARKELDTADIVRDAMLRQLRDPHCHQNPICPLFLFQDSNLRNLSATTSASAQFCPEQLL